MFTSWIISATIKMAVLQNCREGISSAPYLSKVRKRVYFYWIRFIVTFNHSNKVASCKSKGVQLLTFIKWSFPCFDNASRCYTLQELHQLQSKTMKAIISDSMQVYGQTFVQSIALKQSLNISSVLSSTPNIIT